MTLPEHGAMPADDILTLREVAGLLKVADKTVYTMGRQREIPAFEVRGQWRFRDGTSTGIGRQQSTGAGEGSR